MLCSRMFSKPAQSLATFLADPISNQVLSALQNASGVTGLKRKEILQDGLGGFGDVPKTRPVGASKEDK